MFKPCVAVALACLGLATAQAASPLLHTFKKVQLSDQFWSEGANFGDFNHDGVVDIVSGPYWYEGPAFTNRHEYYPAEKTFTRSKADGSTETIPGFEGGLGIKNAYSDNFFTFVYDFNNDGWPDILVYGFPGETAIWYENPKGREGHWQRHVIYHNVENESPTFTDVDGDGKPEIVCNSGGYFGYCAADWAHPDKPWTFHPITPDGPWQRFTHGLGVGDVNGDGRRDILEKDGWWEQPTSLAGDSVWKFHPFPFAAARGASQMYVYDVNGDGNNDVICALAAHGYGLAWFEQTKGTNGEITFIRHIILDEQTGNAKPAADKYGVVFSQLHAIELVDVDGDGLKDIVTGKRFWAHGHDGPDPESDAPAVLYWFKLVRGKHGEVEFVPHLIDSNSGVGTQVVAGNVSNQKFPDIVVGNKKGTFLFKHETKKVSRKEYERAEPKVLSEK